MLYEWVSAGAQIGITAFFAVAMFALLCLALLGLLGLMSRVAKWLGDGGEMRR